MDYLKGLEMVLRALVGESEMFPDRMNRRAIALNECGFVETTQLHHRERE
jgi:hypothetical protein